jgi:hypothetical protein
MSPFLLASVVFCKPIAWHLHAKHGHGWHEGEGVRKPSKDVFGVGVHCIDVPYCNALGKYESFLVDGKRINSLFKNN